MKMVRVSARAGTRSWPRLGAAALVAVVVAMGSGVGAPAWGATGAGKPGTTAAIQTDHRETDRKKPAAAANARPDAGRRAARDRAGRDTAPAKAPAAPSVASQRRIGGRKHSGGTAATPLASASAAPDPTLGRRIGTAAPAAWG